MSRTRVFWKMLVCSGWDGLKLAATFTTRFAGGKQNTRCLQMYRSRSVFTVVCRILIYRTHAIDILVCRCTCCVVSGRRPAFRVSFCETFRTAHKLRLRTKTGRAKVKTLGGRAGKIQTRSGVVLKSRSAPFGKVHQVCVVLEQTAR